jgi:hypothetical protein
MAKPQETAMQPDQTSILMSANRFELIAPWGQPVDKEWALRQLVAWLDNRLDLTRPTVYDGGIPLKGNEHG